MVTKPGKPLVKNAIEQMGEVGSNTLKAAKDQGAQALDAAGQQMGFRSFFVGLDHVMTPEQEEAREREEKMNKLEGFKQAKATIDALKGRFTTEETIDDATRKKIEKDETNLVKDLNQFELESHERAKDLSTPDESAEAREERERQLAAEEERKKKLLEQQKNEKMNQPVGSNSRANGRQRMKKKGSTPSYEQMKPENKNQGVG